MLWMGASQRVKDVSYAIACSADDVVPLSRSPARAGSDLLSCPGAQRQHGFCQLGSPDFTRPR
jgi:hypothetical protein